MKLDLTYIDNWSLLLDLKILFKDDPGCLVRQGCEVISGGNEPQYNGWGL
jgi:hypothetical protein